MCNLLTSLGYDFAEQVSDRAGFVIDFAIYIDRSKNQKIAIETDGANWHSSVKQKQRDRFRDYKLKKAGWTVIRFGETFTKEEVEDRINAILHQWQTHPV
jgi:very-short-patch-repair endonuclease